MSDRVIDKRAAATHGGALVLGGILATCGARMAQPTTDPDADLALLATYAVNDAEDYWKAELPAWRDARLVLVDGGRYQTPCGRASREAGPFYCPRDERVYLDLSFLRAIAGDVARAYVIGHEIGHHVQRVTGRLADRPSVDVELEADCFAGRWMRHQQLDPALVDQALAEAQAVGDDRINPGSSPEEWTHGSAEQRKAAVLTGLRGEDCRQ